MKIAFVLAICALACGCTRHQVNADAKNRLTVCGSVRQEDGTPVAKAVIELHKLAKDTPDDVPANSFELTETDASGSFVLRSADERRQYWLSIKSIRGCESLSASELESKRLSVTFRRAAVGDDCESEISPSLNGGCDLNVR